MKEIKTILEAYQQIDFNTHKAALATVVRVEGSSYRRTGARMLVSDTGEFVGGISGGCLEGDALKRARLTMAQNKATIVTYDTSDDDPYQIGVGLGCNGIIDVLLKPLDNTNPDNPVQILSQCADTRKRNVLLTFTKVKGNQPLVNLGDTYLFNSPEYFTENFPIPALLSAIITDVETCLSIGKSQSNTYQTENGEVQIFLEVLLPAIHLVVYGGNYDIYPMVKLAKEIGWKVSVVCNPLKVQKSLFDWADAVIEKEKGTEVSIDEYTVALLMAHDYNTDFNNLQHLLKTEIPYIGLLGPKKRSEKMYKALAEEGKAISESDSARIASPVGLDIGAITPEEIAISIIAEIKTVFSKRSGERLKFRDKPIYE
ncbi:XdhC family protein [Arcicella sp. DC2W]|uniref:XdhC family protein n=1 Tax=Arcicella gelida TaxID=2984195 RepID=A0ABU5RYV2_9BACT|nr:XdhC family protein [Arcicella sp. DC2W]MEA5401395.1 XdhC family protein [Arcicella sp. DC2W]